MAQTNYTPISLYYSTTAAAVPSNTNLVPGELAVNIQDMKLYCENAAGAVTLLASAAGSTGDVVGPASATDKAIVTFDGTTGKLIQNNSGNTIGTTGNTVISVTDNTNAALRITQLGTGNALLVEDSTNPDASPFVIDATGNVGIGTTTPSASLNIVGAVLQQRDSSTAQYTQSAGATFARLWQRRASGTNAAPTIVVSGDDVGDILWSGYDGSGYIGAASITGSIDGTPGTNDMPGRLVFSTTADGASSVTERMRINSAGAVGIGGVPSSARILTLSRNITGGINSTGARIDGVIQSDVTSNYRGFHNITSTTATSFALSNAFGFYAEQGTIGATSSITSQYGYFAESTLTGATNNYGFYGDIPSGTNRFNLYMNGTAENYLAGNLKIGGTAARGTTAGTNHLSLFNGTAPAGTLTNGVSMYSASGDLSFIDAAGGAYKVGYRNIPLSGIKTSSYTLVAGDVGKFVELGTSGTIVVPASVFTTGDAISIFNNTSASISCTCSAITTVYKGGTDADISSFSVATRGVATILFITATVAVVTGNLA